MKNTNIIIRIEEELKNDLQDIANKNHYTISNIIIACIKDIVRKKKIPINLLPYLNSKPNNNKINIPLIKRALFEILEQNGINNVSKAYLFGSYAKGYANDLSDVDLCISTSLKGLEFIGLIEELRTVLHKKIDLLRLSDLMNNEELLQEIMKDGIKIYG